MKLIKQLFNIFSKQILHYYFIKWIKNNEKVVNHDLLKSQDILENKDKNTGKDNTIKLSNNDYSSIISSSDSEELTYSIKNNQEVKKISRSSSLSSVINLLNNQNTKLYDVDLNSVKSSQNSQIEYPSDTTELSDTKLDLINNIENINKNYSNTYNNSVPLLSDQNNSRRSKDIIKKTSSISLESSEDNLRNSRIPIPRKRINKTFTVNNELDNISKISKESNISSKSFTPIYKTLNDIKYKSNYQNKSLSQYSISSKNTNESVKFTKIPKYRKFNPRKSKLFLDDSSKTIIDKTYNNSIPFSSLPQSSDITHLLQDTDNTQSNLITSNNYISNTPLKQINTIDISLSNDKSVVLNNNELMTFDSDINLYSVSEQEDLYNTSHDIEINSTPYSSSTIVNYLSNDNPKPIKLKDAIIQTSDQSTDESLSESYLYSDSDIDLVNSTVEKEKFVNNELNKSNTLIKINKKPGLPPIPVYKTLYSNKLENIRVFYILFRKIY